MFGLEVLVVFGTTVLIVSLVGARLNVAPPVLLVLVGTLLGMVPLLSGLALDPDVVLLLFLPPILYWESLNTSLREIQANLRVIILVGVVLVLVTAATVSYTAQALGVDPGAAWVLGAVLSPTDAAAVAGLARQLPRRAQTTIRAESLVNDGTALVLFAVAVAVAVGEATVELLGLTGRFVYSYGGGLVAGLLVGRAVILARRHLHDPVLGATLSVLTPLVAFLAAELVQASGVVAVVVAGLMLARAAPRLVQARSRVQAYAFWSIAAFLLNGSLFVLIGTQLPSALRGLDSTTFGRAAVIALVVAAVVIGTRLAFMILAAYALRLLDRRPSQRLRRVGWRQRTAIGWAGFRGGLSLAAALAVPTATAAGEPIPDRDLIIFVTAVVITVTIVVQGTTLPAVVRWARLTADTDRATELALAQTTATSAALQALPQLADDLGVDPDVARDVRLEYEAHAKELSIDRQTDEGQHAARRRERLTELRLAMLDRKRSQVVDLRDSGQIDDIVLREVQAALDLEEVRLLGPLPPD